MNVLKNCFLHVFMFFLLINSMLSAQNEIWRDPYQPLDKRVSDLLSKLTMEEKASLLLLDAPAIPRVGVPAYNWSHECLHGVARAGKATVFPQAIALAATFDSALVYQVADAISDEARAKYLAFLKRGITGNFTGLTFFSPNINIFRDPRWGRGMETYGEDPFLTSRIGVAFVKGLQGNHPKYLKTAACAKHFVAHSGPEKDRQLNNPTPSLKDLYETYTPHFKALIQEANVATVMVTYNKLYSIPLCASPFVNRTLLRKNLGFKGLIMTDGGALNHMHASQGYTKNVTGTCAAAMQAGIQFELGNQFDSVPNAVRLGKIREKTIDSAAAAVLKIRFQLGMMDPLDLNPYNTISQDVVNCTKHRELARKAAAASIVLLKNNGVLPFKEDIKKIYAVGPNATNGDVLFGNYNGFTGNMSLPLEGLVNRLPNGTILEYRPGCRLDQNNITKADWTDVSHNFDVIVAYMGLSPVIEGEEGEAISSIGEGDRLELSLPQNQVAYLKKQRSYGKKPIILVLFGGSPIINKEIYDLADAVLYCWYPGEEGGNAIADILLGNEVPCGRLPITFPMSESQLPEFGNYSMQGRTYRFMKQEPLFPFGFGLSYTQFQYTQIQVKNPVVKSGAPVFVTVTLTNSGAFDASEVAQLYLTLPNTAFEPSNYALKGIRKVAVAAGTSVVVQFTLTPDMYKGYTKDGVEQIYKGTYTVYVGPSSPHPRSQALGAPKPAQATFTIQ